MKRVVATHDAPKAIGPYSQAIAAGGFLWCSGQVALDPATGAFLAGGTGDDAVRSQTRQVLANLAAVVTAAGASLTDVVRCTVYLTDMAHFAAMNEVYAAFFPPDAGPPARATVAVAGLPKGALVEIDCVARLGA